MATPLSESAAALGIDSYRPPVSGLRHAVVAGHYGAAHAAMRVLEGGGNAIDAGVAAGIALGVLQSDLVSFAGVAPILVYIAERREVLSIAGLGGWPMAASVDALRSQHGGRIPPGLLRTVVPAAPAAWISALRNFGTMSFGDVAQAAIDFARDGFAMHELMASVIRDHEDGYRRWDANAAIYLPGGRPPAVGTLFRQTDLARTLQFMVDEERKAISKGRAAGLDAAHDAFYRGDIAATFVRYYRDNGGWLAAQDLASFEPAIEKAVRVRYKGYDLYTCPPWCQGAILGETLKVLEGIDLAALGHNSAAYVHTLVEAMKLTFADRERYFGDPRFVDVPLGRLLSDEYAGRLRARIRPDHVFDGMPSAQPLEQPSAAAADLSHLDTSYVCVADAAGNLFSATPSDATCESPVVPGTGLMLSSRGAQSFTQAGHPSVVAPGKRPRLTPSPMIAFGPPGAGGRRAIPFGSPGGDVQIQAMLQVFLNYAEFGMDPQRAVEAPRVATYGFPATADPHAYAPRKIKLEGRFPAATGAALARLGHDVQWWPQFGWQSGGACMISADPQSGLLTTGADPRRPSYALAW
jgi:gamma-glutamyltranspeptidase/glutathione hydrolase